MTKTLQKLIEGAEKKVDAIMLDLHKELKAIVKDIIVDLLRDGLKFKWVGLGGMGAYFISLEEGAYDWATHLDLTDSGLDHLSRQVMSYDDPEECEGEVLFVEVFPRLTELAEIATYIEEEPRMGVIIFEKEDIQRIKETLTNLEN